MTQQQTIPDTSSIERALARIDQLTPAQRDLLERVLAQSGVDLGIRRRPAGGEVPASYEQERLWFMAQLVAHPEMFHVPTALRLGGELDEDALGRALACLVARHEALRTVFRNTDAGLRQVVLDELAVPLRIEDVRGSEDPWAEACRRGSASVNEAFDLDQGPLVRCRLYRTAPREYLFVFTEHHIISDYWSLGIVLADLGALYAHEIGVGPEPEPLPLHYPDFAVWQRTAMRQEAVKTQLEYWLERLAGLPESLDLPTDRARPAIRGSQGKFFRVAFGPELVGPLRALAGSESATLLGAFLGAYFGLLSRLVRGEDIIVGVPVAGRPRPEMQRMVGYFLNWLPIRLDVGDRPSLRELVRRAGSALAEAMANQALPFDMLVQELDPARRPGTTPVFQTSFSLRDSAPEPPGLPGVEVSFADIEGSATHFDLMAELWQEGDGVVGYLPYDEELFDESTVAAIARWFERLLAAGLERPDEPVATLPVFEDHEQVLLPGRAIEGVPRAETTLHARFARQVQLRPEARAVSDGDVELSYAELDRRANRIANLLQAQGVRAGDVVALVLERTVDLAAAVLGVLKTGAAYLPADPESPPERIARQFASTPVTAVLVSPDCTEVIPDSSVAITVLDWDGALAAAPDTPVAVDVPADSPAYVIYTSGSTGVPKGVLVSHDNVLRLFEAAGRPFDIGPDDTWTLFHSFAFDFSVWELWGPLLHGGRLVVVPQWMTRAPDVLADHLGEEGVTVLSATPSAFGQLASQVLRKPRRELALRYVVFGGEALNHSALRTWFDAFGDEQPQLINMYGISETTVHVTHRRVTRADLDRPESLIGEPLEDLSLYLLDGDLQPVPTGVPGEIFVGGRGVALGYGGDPALTAQRMLPDPWSPVPGSRMYRSGDIAVRRRDGELAYLGRGDDQHKIRGHRVELGEVRAALDGLAEVGQAAVVVSTDRVGAKTLLAWVVPEPGASASGAQIRRALLRSLPDWMVPSSIEVVPALPLTRNGKLDQAALTGRSAERADGEVAAGPAPEGPTGERLAAIWSELLGIGAPRADAHFFEIGGHSLMVVQLVTRIRAAFEVDIPMAVLFERPHLQAMADAIDALAGARSAGSHQPATSRPGMVELPPDAPIEAVRADIARRLEGLARPAGSRPAAAPVAGDGAETVLVTGATGFVGAHVLTELLSRGLHVVCLVRGGATRRQELLARAERAGRHHAVAAGLDAGMVELVDGDLGAARLGLPDATYRDLAERVDAIVHAGAWVNHVYPYAQLAPVNAHSAGALLELAGTGRRKRIGYVSASSVIESGAYLPGEQIGAEPVRALPSGPIGYPRSKAVAEEYFRHAAEFDVAAVVIRIPSVFGDRERYAVNDSDAVWSWTRAMLMTGSYPASFANPSNELFQALPADAIARIVIDQVLDADRPGCRYVNAIPDVVCTTWDLVAAAQLCGWQLQAAADADWYEQVSRLDAATIWVAGIAAGVARSIAAHPGPIAPRRLHRFSPGGGPELGQLLDEQAIRTPQEISGYLRTLIEPEHAPEPVGHPATQ